MMREGRTKRLVLRPLEMADAERIQELLPHWEIVRYLLNRVPWPYPPDGALQYCREIALPQMERGDAWHWTLRLSAEPSQMAGFISLVKGDEDNRGFWLGLPWQGRGLMSRLAPGPTISGLRRSDSRFCGWPRRPPTGHRAASRRNKA
jgi:RimJ/RimL family protein N-acetyltransferase